MNPAGRPVNDTLTNLGLAALIGAAALAGVLRLAGTVATALAGTPVPSAGVAAGLAVLTAPTKPSGPLHAPGLNPVL